MTQPYWDPDGELRSRADAYLGGASVPPPVTSQAPVGVLAPPQEPTMAPPLDGGVSRPPAEASFPPVMPANALSPGVSEIVQGAIDTKEPASPATREPVSMERDVAAAPGQPVQARPMAVGGVPQNGALYKTYADERGAMAKESSAASDAIQAQMQGLANVSTAQNLMAQRETEIAQSVKADDDAYQAQTEKERGDFAKLDVDPKRLFHNMDTFTKALMLLGAAAGGIQSGIRGGENQFLKQINGMVEQDTAAQSANINNRARNIEMRRGVYRDMVQNHKDETTARFNTNLLKLEAIRGAYEAEVMGARSEVARAQGERGLFQLDRELEKLKVADAQRRAAASAAASSKAFDDKIKLLDASSRAITAQSGRAEAAAKYFDTTGHMPQGYEDANAGAGVPKQVREEVQNLSKEMQAAKVPEGRAAYEQLQRRFPVENAGKDIQGVGPVASWLPDLTPGFLGVGEEGRLNRQTINQLFDVYRHNVTGAGAGTNELDRLRKSALGAQTTPELWAAIDAAKRHHEAVVSNVRQGYSPQANDIYDQRGQSRGTTAPPSLGPRK